MLRHAGINANEITDQVAREDCSYPPIGTEPALGISVMVDRNWTAGNMRSPNVDKGRLRALLKNCMLKELENCSV